MLAGAPAPHPFLTCLVLVTQTSLSSDKEVLVKGIYDRPAALLIPDDCSAYGVQMATLHGGS